MLPAIRRHTFQHEISLFLRMTSLPDRFPEHGVEHGVRVCVYGMMSVNGNGYIENVFFLLVIFLFAHRICTIF